MEKTPSFFFKNDWLDWWKHWAKMKAIQPVWLEIWEVSLVSLLSTTAWNLDAFLYRKDKPSLGINRHVMNSSSSTRLHWTMWENFYWKNVMCSILAQQTTAKATNAAFEQEMTWYNGSLLQESKAAHSKQTDRCLLVLNFDSEMGASAFPMKYIELPWD